MTDHTDDWPMADTIDGVRVVPGLRVIDYNMDRGVVDSLDHVDNVGTPWFRIIRDKGGWSTMDGLRLWTRLRTNRGTETADCVDHQWVPDDANRRDACDNHGCDAARPWSQEG